MNLIYLGALLPLLAIIAPNAYAHSDQDHWNAGYSDGFYWTGSPANACVHHSHAYCDGFNVGYLRNHGQYYYASTEQNQGASINTRVNGDNNRVTNVINQGQASNTDSGEGSSHGQNPRCVILCANVNVR